MAPADIAPIAAYEPLPATEPAMAEPPPPVEESLGLAGILGVLLAIGIAGVGGFLLIRALRRRRQRITMMDEPVRYEVQREPGQPRRRLSETLRGEVSVTPQAVTRADAASAAPAQVPTAASLAAAGKQEAPKHFVATQLASEQRGTILSQNEAPALVPSDPEEREELIQQMVEAEPDRVNPFQSRKARRKRARLILQSLHRRFEDARPNFDIAKVRRDWNIAPPRRFSPA